MLWIIKRTLSMGVKEHFIISQTKHVLWIFKRTLSMGVKEHFIISQTILKHMLWIILSMGVKEHFIIF